MPGGTGYIMESLAGNAVSQNRFRRSTSFDGIHNWRLDPASSDFLPQAWFSAVSCPDLHYEGNSLILYFRGDDIATGQTMFGRAVSADHGLTWTVNSQPILSPGPPGSWDGAQIENPSVARLNASHVDPANGLAYQYVMAYSGLCQVIQVPVRFYATIGIAYSNDGRRWWKSATNPVITRDVCGTWLDQRVFRPRVVVDPHDSTGNCIHLFFDAYKQVGTSLTGRCARTAHAYSGDGGLTWKVDPYPALDRTRGTNPPGWDTQRTMDTSYTDEGTSLRMYFAGFGGGNLAGIGMAEALWSALPCSGPLVDGASNGSATEEDSSPLSLAPSDQPRLTCDPEPSSGPTTIRLSGRVPATVGTASLRVFDMSGRLVRNVWSGAVAEAPSSWTWDGKSDQGEDAAAGKYLAALQVDGETAASYTFTLLK
ncbi:MAG: FlgD immunoglobulin-like domain containing protein [Candidatus Eisenbacteria bacterium]